jgi:hypothetical protein
LSALFIRRAIHDVRRDPPFKNSIPLARPRDELQELVPTVYPKITPGKHGAVARGARPSVCADGS